MGVEDCALAAENLMLAGQGSAHAVGFAQGWLATAEGKSVLKLSDGLVPVAPIVVGHPKDGIPAVPREPVVIDWM